ncbi:MAG: Molecular chaperone (small heat shock protein) [uncultured Caballeronia sp.]|nr:MAG: Molecular chaperone (small heat shock protein) [uncultured Caballeronia sp.]
MSNPFFNADLFGEIDRLQRQMANLFTSLPSSLRAARIGAFPPVNIGSTDDSVEIVVFAPGLDPAKIKVLIDKGLLTISGEHRPVDAGTAEDTRVYARERFAGAFRRVIELPRHADPDKGARPLCEWLPDGQRRPFRGVEAARDCRPVTDDALRHFVNRTNRNREEYIMSDRTELAERAPESGTAALQRRLRTTRRRRAAASHHACCRRIREPPGDHAVCGPAWRAAREKLNVRMQDGSLYIEGEAVVPMPDGLRVSMRPCAMLCTRVHAEPGFRRIAHRRAVA